MEEPHCGFVNITRKDGRPSALIAYSAGQGCFQELEDFHAAFRIIGKIESTPKKAMRDIETVFALLESARRNKALNPKAASKLTKAYVLPYVTAYPGARSKKAQS